MLSPLSFALFTAALSTAITPTWLLTPGAAQAQRTPINVMTAPEQMAVVTPVVHLYELPCASAVSLSAYDMTHMHVQCSSGEQYALLFNGTMPYVAPWVSVEGLFALQPDPARLARATAINAGTVVPGSTANQLPLAASAAPTTAAPLAPTPPPPASPPVTSQQLTALAGRARDLLDASLLDFPSARFREVRAVRVYARQNGQPVGSGWLAFCGLVNTKNRAGAYGGWTRFYVAPDAPDGTVVGLASERGLGAIAATGRCQLNPPESVSDRDFTANVQP